MASLRERLLRRAAPAPPPEKGANGTEPPVAVKDNNGDNGHLPQNSVQIPQISQVSMLSALSSRSTIPGRSSVGVRGGQSFASRIEVAPLSPVEQLKVDLHRRLIERLDLEALEQITDESVSTRSPSTSTGIRRNGLSFENRSSPKNGTRWSTSYGMPLISRHTSTLRT